MYFVKKLHRYGGKTLYFNMFGTMILGLLNGIGMLLMLPMLGIIGFVDIPLTTIPGLHLLAPLQEMRLEVALPIILGLYVTLVITQQLISRHLSLREVEIHTGFVNQIRLETYRGMLQANWKFLLGKRRADIVYTLSGEVGRVTGSTYNILQFFASLIYTVVQIIIAFIVSYQMTLFVLGCGLVVMFFSRKFISESKKLGSLVIELAQNYMAGISDHFNGIKEVKSNQLERSLYNWMKDWANQFAQERYKNIKLRSNSELVFNVASTIIITLFIYVSIMLFRDQGAYLLVILAIFSRLWPRVSSIQSNLEEIAAVAPSFRTLMELQQEYEAAAELDCEASPSTDSRLAIHRELECRAVSFRYNKDNPEHTLSSIHVQIAANEMTAIVGPSGAGKSTLVDLIMGLIEPDSGEVLVDGKSLSTADRVALRDSISYVSQDPFLFYGTVRDNMLLISPEATEKELWDALTFASAAEFVRNLPEGLDTLIGDRGIRLSGGERQRLVLARAILRRPSILVLDEATSSLDTENETRIQEALDNLKGKLTIIVIAHRMSTICNADHVIVLEDGRVVQSGRFNDLSEDKVGLFSKLLGGNQQQIA